MAITRVAHTHFETLNTATSSPGVDTTGATIIIIHTARYSGAGAGSIAISDSKGNSWTALTEQSNAEGSSRIYYCINPIVGSGHTFTATGITIAVAVQVAAFSGINPAFGAETGALTHTGTSLATGSLTPSANGALIISGFSAETAQTGTLSVSASLTISDQAAGAGGLNENGALAWFEQSTAGAINPNWTWVGSASREAAATLAVFVPSPAVSVSVSFVSSGVFAPTDAGQVLRSALMVGAGIFAPDSGGGKSVAFSGAGTFAPVAVTGLQRSVAFTGSGAFAPVAQSSGIKVWVRCPYLESDTVGTKSFTVYEYVSGSEVSVTVASSQFTAIPNITNGWWLVFQVPPNDGFGGGSYIVVFANINSGYRALEAYAPPTSTPSSLKRTKLAAYRDSDTIGTATYQLYVLSGLNVVTSGSPTTTGFISVTNITNGKAVNYTFTPDANNGYLAAVEWSG